jgi:peptidoglycan/xylan/chitin deacetylase (PgdA/CDA1 family)
MERILMKSYLIRRLTVLLVVTLTGLAVNLFVLTRLAHAANPDLLPTPLLPAPGAVAPAAAPISGLRPAEITPDYVNFVAEHELERGSRAQANIALTFDCGGSAAALKNILALLKEGQAQGTFFLEGELVEKSPEIVPLILADGHEVANHSYNHPRFTTLTQTQVISELTQTEALISAAAGQPMPLRYFRFPYGDRNQERRDWAAQLGYQSVFWDIDAQGWRSTITATDVISVVVNTAQSGSIVLMHCTAAADREALSTVITELQAKGYQLVTLSEVVKE